MDNTGLIKRVTQLAGLISPSHAMAVSQYLMDALACDCEECSLMIMKALIGVVSEINVGVDISERDGFALRAVPLPAEIVAEMDADVANIYTELRMEDGKFTGW